MGKMGVACAASFTVLLRHNKDTAAIATPMQYKPSVIHSNRGR